MAGFEERLAGPESTREGVAAAERSLSTEAHRRLFGGLVFVAFAQVMALLVVVDNSPLIPGLVGSGVNYEPYMVYYLFLLTAVAFPIVGFAPSLVARRRGQRSVNLATGGRLTRWALSFGATGFAAWALLGVAGVALSVVYTPISGAERLGFLVFDSLFVAATEEIVFRMALPLVMNPWLASCVLFPLAHLPVDATVFGGNVELYAMAFVQRALAGAVLWVIYSRVNLAAAIAAHFIYDAFLGGGLPMGAPLGLARLGLVTV